MYTSSLEHTKLNENSQNVFCVQMPCVNEVMEPYDTDEISCIFLERKLVNRSDLTEHNSKVEGIFKKQTRQMFWSLSCCKNIEAM